MLEPPNSKAHLVKINTLPVLQTPRAPNVKGYVCGTKVRAGTDHYVFCVHIDVPVCLYVSLHVHVREYKCNYVHMCVESRSRL